jgi:ribosomal protein S18 acetylase RimI-like enzyme
MFEKTSTEKLAQMIAAIYVSEQHRSSSVDRRVINEIAKELDKRNQRDVEYCVHAEEQRLLQRMAN